MKPKKPSFLKQVALADIRRDRDARRIARLVQAERQRCLDVLAHSGGADWATYAESVMLHIEGEELSDLAVCNEQHRCYTIVRTIPEAVANRDEPTRLQVERAVREAILDGVSLEADLASLIVQ